MTSTGPASKTPRSPIGTRRRRVLAAAAVTFLALATLAVVATRRDEPSAQRGHAQVHRDLCDALRTGDPAAAAASFTRRIHTPLHELAANAETVDRAATARLLEAKQRVEADLEGGDQTGALRDLAVLEPLVRDALSATGISTTPCREPSS